MGAGARPCGTSVVTARHALILQRAAGNRAVTGLMRMRPVGSCRGPQVVQRDYERPGLAGGVYESEQFGGGSSKRERPTYVEIPIRPAGTAGRTAAPPPLSQFEHGGKLNLEGTARKPGFDGGHIVGLHIGGEDIPENVVPMFKAFNRGVYKNMEDHVKQLSETLRSAGKGGWVAVHCYYDDETADTPYAFDIVVESTPRGSDTRAAEWSAFLSQPWDIKVVAPLNEDDQKMVRGEVDADDVRKAAGSGLLQTAQFFAVPSGQTVATYVNTIRHLPPTTNGMFPDSPALRPYEFLDMLVLANKLAGVGSLRPFDDFSGRQRELILQANMARNGGKLKSDDPLDPLPDLSEMGDLNFPEVDHIVPKSRGGSNMFSNARLVSWKLNNVDDRVKSLFGVIDMNKRPLPPLAGMGKKDIPVLVENYVHRVRPPGVFTTGDVWRWGTENFPVMGGQRGTPGRLGLVNAALRRMTLIKATSGGFEINK